MHNNDRYIDKSLLILTKSIPLLTKRILCGRIMSYAKGAIVLTNTRINTKNEGVAVVTNKQEDIKIKAEFNISVLCKVLTIISLGVVLLAVVFMGSMNYVTFTLFCSLAFLVALAGCIISRLSEKMEFYVTEEHVVSTTLFGNTRFFAIDEIQLVRLSTPSSITLASKDNKIVAYFIKNRKEISGVINKLTIKK